MSKAVRCHKDVASFTSNELTPEHTHFRALILAKSDQQDSSDYLNVGLYWKFVCKTPESRDDELSKYVYYLMRGGSTFVVDFQFATFPDGVTQ